MPVRTIAQDAGVSPALVIHHFGTKDALRAACDEHVLRQIGEAENDSVVRGSPGDMLAQLAAVEQYAPATGYVVQALLAGGHLSQAFLERLVHDTEQYLQEGVEAGRIRPSRDPAARARYLVYVGMGALVMHLRLQPPADGDLGPALRSYADAVALPALELYTDGLLTDRTMLDAYLDSPPAPSGGAS